jgi:hypothetical protein
MQFITEREVVKARPIHSPTIDKRLSAAESMVGGWDEKTVGFLVESIGCYAELISYERNAWSFAVRIPDMEYLSAKAFRSSRAALRALTLWVGENILEKMPYSTKHLSEMKISELIEFVERQAAIEAQNLDQGDIDPARTESWANTLALLRVIKTRGVPPSLEDPAR